MARYYFDLTNGHGTTVDEDGQVFSTADEAAREALRLLAEIALDEQVESNDLAFSVDVRTEGGDVFYQGRLSLFGRWVSTPP